MSVTALYPRYGKFDICVRTDYQFFEYLVRICFTLGFIDHLKTQVVQMPLKGDNQTISMYVLLPESGTTVEDLLKKITPGFLDDIFKSVNLKPEKIFLRYPLIPFEKEVDLIPVCLSALYMSALY